jgi:hypothetical protein
MIAWLTTDENKELRRQLAKSLSFEAVASKHCSRIEPVSSATWTHKCTCPFHKGGNERTPSLHISDTEKTFFCYGCSARGDIFDFIGMIRGSPGDVIAMKYKESKNIILDIPGTANAKPKTDIYEIGLQLSVAIREYIKSKVGEPSYEDDILWADSIFKRIDERFSKLTSDNPEHARNFSMQIMMELERRKL